MLALVLAASGCSKLAAKEAAPADPHAATAPAAEAQPAAHAAAPTGPARFGVPFAWETSPDEPLAKARAFMNEVLRANEGLVTLGREHFAPFLSAQHPRATVLACADSRVQANAWDSSPEDDDFTVRNIGNQVENSLGSVEYGVEHLHTPVLLVIGHTGCGAVKAALGKTDGLAAPIAKELAPMKLPAPRAGATPDQIWADAVVANVHAQVALAVEHFGPFVHSGELTVIGAVYDLKNDLGKGFGRLHLVDINTNVEPARIDAFVRAIQSASLAKKAEAAPGKLTGAEALGSISDARVRATLERAAVVPARPEPKKPGPNAPTAVPQSGRASAQRK
jgi:carbonic anhydrase